MAVALTGCGGLTSVTDAGSRFAADASTGSTLDGGDDAGASDAGATKDAGADAGRGDAGIFDGCPPRSLMFGPNVWGTGQVLTSSIGEFSDNVASFRIIAPVPRRSNAETSITFVEFQGPATTRELVLSTQPCDFSNTNTVKDQNGQPATSTGMISPGVILRSLPGRDGVVITPGVPYYINVKNRDPQGGPTCTTDCIMQGTFRDW